MAALAPLSQKLIIAIIYRSGTTRRLFMQVKSILFQLALVIAAASFATGAAATMYKWTDKDGTVHYTETPPEEGNATTIAPPPHVEPPPASPNEQTRDNRGDASKSKTGEKSDKEEAPLTPEQQAIYARNCEAAKANLELFQKSSRYQQTDGKVVEMDEEMRQKKTSQAEEQVKRYCK
jgi:hypothetical protein